jgi:hypothetical protein
MHQYQIQRLLLLQAAARKGLRAVRRFAEVAPGARHLCRFTVRIFSDA